ncbi:hypothetical protein ACOBR2_08480 [Telmatobacter bradus]
MAGRILSSPEVKNAAKGFQTTLASGREDGVTFMRFNKIAGEPQKIAN